MQFSSANQKNHIFYFYKSPPFRRLRDQKKRRVLGTRMVVTRCLDFWCWPKRLWPLGSSMGPFALKILGILNWWGNSGCIVTVRQKTTFHVKPNINNSLSELKTDEIQNMLEAKAFIQINYRSPLVRVFLAGLPANTPCLP